MSRICVVTGKKPMTGNKVSHANNKTKRRYLPNLQKHRFWVESENRFVTLRITTRAMRTIDKVGIDVVLAKLDAVKKPAKRNGTCTSNRTKKQASRAAA